MAGPLQLLFIGCGNMGAAIVGGALRNLPGVHITALDPEVDRARSLLPPGAEVDLHGSLSEISGIRPDLTILGTKPQTFPTLADELVGLIRQAPVVSIMAGISLDRLNERLAPAPVVRVMPNLPALVGQGMSLGCTSADIPPELARLVETLFSSIGGFAWAVDEIEFEKANPVFASGPGFVFAFAEQLILAAVSQGVPQDLAERLVIQTITGSAEMLSKDPRGATGLKRAVSSPGGTTLAGLAILEGEDGLPKILPEMLAAAHRRALELAKTA